MDFTTEQEDDLITFTAEVQDFVVRHAAPEKVGMAMWVIDKPEVYGPLCEMIAEFMANHGVDLKYPCHETITDPADGSTEEFVHETTPPTDLEEREHWEKAYGAVKGAGHGK